MEITRTIEIKTADNGDITLNFSPTFSSYDIQKLTEAIMGDSIPPELIEVIERGLAEIANAIRNR